MPNRYRKYSRKYSRRTKKKLEKITTRKQNAGGTQIDLDLEVSYDYGNGNGYGNGNLKVHRGNTISNNFTTAYHTGTLNKEPTTNIIGIMNNTKYLVLMYDPDAPNGQNEIDNYIYTHWIFTQTGNNYNEREILLPYRPPKPPKGIHRYIFSVYNAKNITNDEIENLIKSNEKTKLPIATNLLTHNMQFIVDSKQ